ncbi:protein YIF1A [Tetranychus urticae]|uniref:Protein YIF1 n=1 Tax=Tetranychus urticae TaxID=32264 RepID=T1KKD8_TETUR|nr:protein YIF1A [Tetranychus urticae]
MNRDPNYMPGPMPMGPNPNYPSQMGFPMNYGFPGDQSFLNQQLGNHMAQIFQDQVSQYSDNLVSKSKTWVGNNLKYYFAVDTGYVLKKILLIFFPFTHKDWSLKYRNDEQIAPRDDLNAPDLYIPWMAFVTYILVAGYLLGVNDRFSPEQLGIQASSALAWLIFEVLATMIILYSFNLMSAFGFFHVLSLSGYKFVPMIAALLIALPFSSMGYYISLAYGSLALCYFLIRNIHMAIETSPATQGGGRQSTIKVIFFCLVQPLLMYHLTKHFVV